MKHAGAKPFAEVINVDALKYDFSIHIKKPLLIFINNLRFEDINTALALNIDKQCTIFGTKIITYGFPLSALDDNWTQRKVCIKTKKELTIGYAHGNDVYFYVYIRVNDECPAEAKSKRNSCKILPNLTFEF